MSLTRALVLLPAVSVVHAGTDQPTKLRITNACLKEPMWIASLAGAGVGPDPQNLKIEPGASHDFNVNLGLAATRYWPKLGCDAQGGNCNIGESGGPGETCDPQYGCAPPVDTKFEASFGMDGNDFVDISLVDGFTLPFKLELFPAEGKTCGSGGDKNASNVIDCSHLSLKTCPYAEDLGVVGKDMDLQVTHPHKNHTVGCYSPCGKLTFRNWDNPAAAGRMPTDPEVKDYCCPTPPESVDQCHNGPVKDTKFVKAVHTECPGVYSYAYDDGIGLLRCPDDTKYHVSFYCHAPREEEEALDTIVI